MIERFVNIIVHGISNLFSAKTQTVLYYCTVLYLLYLKAYGAWDRMMPAAVNGKRRRKRRRRRNSQKVKPTRGLQHGDVAKTPHEPDARNVRTPNVNQTKTTDIPTGLDAVNHKRNRQKVGLRLCIFDAFCFAFYFFIFFSVFLEVVSNEMPPAQCNFILLKIFLGNLKSSVKTEPVCLIEICLETKIRNNTVMDSGTL